MDEALKENETVRYSNVLLSVGDFEIVMLRYVSGSKIPLLEKFKFPLVVTLDH